MSTLPPSQTLSDHPIFSPTCPMDHLMISQYRGKSADTTYVRYNLDLPEALRETIIIATAREIKSQYEFYAHARLARQAGVAEDTIQAIARGTAPQGLSGDEAMLVRYVQELLRHHKISNATFNAVRDRFGMQKTLEITGLVGHYLLVGQILAAFEVDLPEGAKPE